jgi:putative Mg2+ transporter-C (MgtC) family protein
LKVHLAGITFDPRESTPTRVVSYVVSVIGFLGGGVIIRKGFTVRGLNTAPTLWRAAAVGCLAGWGFVPEASIAALSIVAANVLQRPLAMKINRQPLQNTEVETHYTSWSYAALKMRPTYEPCFYTG